VRELLVDMNYGCHQQSAHSSISRTSQGTWSSGRHLPMGALTARSDGRTLLWQVENPGGWRWEVGEHADADADALYMALLGPTDRERPLGLPGWTDPWIALGLRGRERTYVTVWRRSAQESAAERTLAIPHLKDRDATVRILFPQDTKAAVRWGAGRGELTVCLPELGTACLLTLE